MEITTLLKHAFYAGVIAGIINSIIFLIAKSNGGVSDTTLLPGGKPLSLASVIVSSLGTAILAAFVLFVLAKFTGNPVRVFTIVAVVLLLLSLAGSFGIPRIPVQTRLVLALMHLVAAGLIIYFLRK